MDTSSISVSLRGEQADGVRGPERGAGFFSEDMSSSFKARMASPGELIEVEEVAASLAMARATSRSLGAFEGVLIIRTSDCRQPMPYTHDGALTTVSLKADERE